MESCIGQQNGRLKSSHAPGNKSGGSSTVQPKRRRIQSLKFDLTTNPFARELHREQDLKEAAEVLSLLASD